MSFILDDALQLSTTNLRKWGYLGRSKKGNISWYANNVSTDRITLASNIDNDPYIELSYTYGGVRHDHKIELATIPSNLGNGDIMYFICPHTGKQCRKLYMIGGFFAHRQMFTKCMYKNQTQSKEKRNFHKFCKTYFRNDKIIEQLTKKHLKKQYAGRPTKKYLKLMERLQRAEKIPYYEYEKFFIK